MDDKINALLKEMAQAVMAFEARRLRKETE